MNSKKTAIVLAIITIINIVLLIYGFIKGSLSPHSFNESLDTQNNNTIFVIITLLLQILNLIIIKFGKKKKIFIMISIAIIIITFFMPVKTKYRVDYRQQNVVRNNPKEIGQIIDLGATIYTSKHKNIYGITLKTHKETHGGMDIY